MGLTLRLEDQFETQLASEGGPAGRGLGRGRWPGCGEWPPLPLSHCVTASEAWPQPRDCLSLPWPAWGLGGLGPFGLPQGTHRHIHKEHMFWGSTERVLYRGRVVWQCLLHVWAFSKTEAQDTNMPFVHIAGFLLHRWGGFPDPNSRAALTPAVVRPHKRLHMGQETIMPGRPSLPVRLLWKGREDT